MLTIDLNQSSRDVVLERHLGAVTDVMIKAKKTLVVTGAGISCSSGIPDFRSADGLYNLVKKQYPKTVLKGKDLFDANLFRDCTTTAVFYTFISELHAQTLKAKPSPTHHFIKMLSEKGKLLRCYTQNIDCLEEELGMETSLVCEKGKVKKDVNVVQLHGSLRKLKCTLCSEPYGFLTDFEKVFREGEAPDCPKCELNDAIGRIQVSDLQKSPDVLLVMGTSLKVHGLRLLVRKAAKAVHENKKGCVILVNKTPVVGKEWSGVFDYFIEGETDRWCHIVEDALRKVKVQTKLPFKAITAEQKEKQMQSKEQEKQDQEQSSDKENDVPVSLAKKHTSGKKRAFAVMQGHKISDDIVSESIQAAMGATGLGGSTAPARSTSASILVINNANQERAVATCRKRTISASASPTPAAAPLSPSSPTKQNTLGSMHVSKASIRRPILTKVNKVPGDTRERFSSIEVHQPIAPLRRTRSSARADN
ncbi:hypothetical protein BGZ70_009038 [Mortierella alpina]|uniref:Deacetylase sirtuin-type domain-containing protein n=1 Tax=Mortierella alpina TaxID=64518 RepID=A0A9P6M6D4_MORAP|nr:hypothetical protein BGZ70_009038 [Mortierella alpina]